MISTYTIADLEKMTGVSRRTIHYYIMEKLLPPPLGAGLSAKYREEHFLRLVLINQMQKSHLRLTGIREALDGMKIEDMKRLVNEINRSRAVWNFESIKNWLRGNTATKDIEDNTAISIGEATKNYSLVTDSQPETPHTEVKGNPNYLERLSRNTTLNNTSWRRISVVDGLEINIRSDIEQQYGYVLLPMLEQLKKNLP